ncbi:lamin tail domain-containing protein [Nanoarchaeota archaeon]
MKVATAMRRRVRRFLYVLVMVLMSGLCLAADHVVISEVYYDPIGTETGGEAVELYNPTGGDVDISGYVIATESSASDAVVPGGTVLLSGGYYLITDTGWSGLKDDAGWPDADHEEAITMSNTDAGVALLYPNGTSVDAVGWGSAAGIGAGLSEGTPAVDVGAGMSLLRSDVGSDSDDNSVDFVESAAELQNSASGGGGESNITDTNSSESIEMSVSVTNTAPSVASVSVLSDDDGAVAGVQVIPEPEGVKDILISAEVIDPDGTAGLSVAAQVVGPGGSTDIVLALAQVIDNTTSLFNATLGMQFYDGAGMYNVTVTVNDSSLIGEGSVEFDYLSMAAISIDAGSLQFSGAKLGETSQIDGDFALSTADSPSVRNVGNTQLDVGLYGTDLVDGASSIGIGNVKYSFDNDFESELSGVLSGSLEINSLGLVNGADSVTSLGFQLFVPMSTPNGDYAGNITIVAVSS